MASQYLLKPVRPLGRACAEIIGCDPDGESCAHPDCRLGKICPRWAASLAFMTAPRPTISTGPAISPRPRVDESG